MAFGHCHWAGLLIALVGVACAQGNRWVDQRDSTGECSALRVRADATQAAELPLVCERLARLNWSDGGLRPSAGTNDACVAYTRATKVACAEVGVKLLDPPAWMRIDDAEQTTLEVESASPQGTMQPAPHYRLPARGLDVTWIPMLPMEPLMHPYDKACPSVRTVLSLVPTLNTTEPCSGVLVSPTTFLTAAHCKPGAATVATVRRGTRLEQVKLKCSTPKDYGCEGNHPTAWGLGCTRDIAVCRTVDQGVVLYPDVAPERISTDGGVLKSLRQHQKPVHFVGQAKTSFCTSSSGSGSIAHLPDQNAELAWQRLLTLDSVTADYGDSGGPAFDALTAPRQLLGIVFQSSADRKQTYIGPLSDPSLQCFLACVVKRRPQAGPIAGIKPAGELACSCDDVD
jgi:hypothetical protein